MNNTNYKQAEIGEIPGDWKVIPLGELMSIKHGYAFKGKYFSDEMTDNILLTPGNVAIGGGFQGDKYKYYDGEIPADYILSKGDLFVSMTDLSKAGDTLGYSALVPNEANKLFLHNQRLGLVKIKSKSATKDFIYWKLRDPIYRSNVLGSATGTTVKHTSPGRITEIEIALPPLNEQQKIASILSSLDDKIELNHRMNKTLEELGKALFKRWFVDFEFLNENGEPYKSSGGEMVDSELGKIPDGWNLKTIDEVCNTFGGGTPSTRNDDYWKDGNILWATPTDITALKSPIIFNTNRKITKEGLNNSSAKLLPTGTILLTSRATVGLLAVSDMPIATNQGFIAIECTGIPSNYYMYFELLGRQHEIINKATGSTFREISRSTFRAMNFLLPTKELHDEYSSVAGSLFEHIRTNTLENEYLSGIRDSLLPRLMSGKIRVN